MIVIEVCSIIVLVNQNITIYYQILTESRCSGTTIQIESIISSGNVVIDKLYIFEYACRGSFIDCSTC